VTTSTVDTSTPDPRDPRDEEELDWRGVASDEISDDISDEASGLLRDRSRALLGQLLQPHRRLIHLLIAVVLVENAARQIGRAHV